MTHRVGMFGFLIIVRNKWADSMISFSSIGHAFIE